MLYIPIEIFSREYRSKLAVAMHVCNTGIPVCFGHKSFVRNLYKSRQVKGIIYNKGVGDQVQKEDYEIDLEAGYKFVAQDEEAGIIFKNFSDFYQERSSLHNLNQVSKFFTWGDADQCFFENQTPHINKTILTGSPRTSFWGNLGHEIYKKEIQNIKSKFGSYIFFPTNFATYNSFLGERRYNKHLENFSYYRDTGFQDLIDREQRKYEMQMMNFVTESVAEICTKLKKSVIIRPHPGEDVNTWRKIRNKMPSEIRQKLHVLREGDVTPWILAADLVVQRGCTTGLEAILSHVPVVSYVLEPWEKQDPKRSFVDENTVSVKTVAELLSFISNGTENILSNEFLENARAKVKDAGNDMNIVSISKQICELHSLSQFESINNLRSARFSTLKDLARMHFPRLNKNAQILDRNKRPMLTLRTVKEHIERMAIPLRIEQNFNLDLVAPSTFLMTKN